MNENQRSAEQGNILQLNNRGYRDNGWHYELRTRCVHLWGNQTNLWKLSEHVLARPSCSLVLEPGPSLPAGPTWVFLQATPTERPSPKEWTAQDDKQQVTSSDLLRARVCPQGGFYLGSCSYNVKPTASTEIAILTYFSNRWVAVGCIRLGIETPAILEWWSVICKWTEIH